MKRFTFTLIIGALAALGLRSANAQQGVIRYDRVQKIEIQLPPEMEHMKDQIPSSRTANRELRFTPTEAVMKDAPKSEDEEGDDTMTLTAGGNRFVMIQSSSDGPEEILYTSLESGETVERRNFLGRTFLISGERRSFPWRLTNEQSEYQGYLTQKAVAAFDSTTVEAWFSPQIPAAVGPDEYGGLPGAILVLSVDDGRISYKATEIDLTAAPEIEVPEDGREVTRAEYEEIVEEKRKEMMSAQRGVEGGIHMRINN